MTPKQQSYRNQQILSSMRALVGDTRFQDFMDTVEEQKETALEDALSDRVISNKKRLLATLGEVRCYKNILSLYDNLQNQAEAEAERAEEEQ